MQTAAQVRAADIKSLRDDSGAKAALIRVLAADLATRRNNLEMADASGVADIAYRQGCIAALRGLKAELEAAR